MLSKRNCFIISFMFMIFLNSVNAQGLIIDHTAVQKFDQIPAYWLEKAKGLTIHYGHTSHGSQIIAGLNYLENYIDSKKYSVAIGERNSQRNPNLPSQENPPALRMWEEGLWPYTDASRNRLGYWDGESAQAGTKNVLKSGLFNVSGWCWCGQVSESDWSYIQEYLDVLTMYEQEFPNVTFFYMTGHSVAPGPPTHQQKAYERLLRNNNGIRDYCRDNNKILFDFADIESWDLDGNFHPEEDGSGVWCDEWCRNHPEDCQNIPVRSEAGGGSSCTTCAHSHGLNCVIKAKAFWYMMARIAGWDGQVNTPVELEGFEGSFIKDGVRLTWTTASEHNNYGFEIWRSQNYLSNFKKIAFIKGHGTIVNKNQYQFIDRDLDEGTYYYQLKQLDNDGSFQFIGKIEVVVNIPKKILLEQNYPNPFNPISNISFNLPKNHQVELTIFDLTGKVVDKLVNGFQNAGYYNIAWDGSDYPTGIYFYELRVDNFKQTKKMILMK